MGRSPLHVHMEMLLTLALADIEMEIEGHCIQAQGRVAPSLLVPVLLGIDVLELTRLQ